jgi:hypothetical protein
MNSYSEQKAEAYDRWFLSVKYAKLRQRAANLSNGDQEAVTAADDARKLLLSSGAEYIAFEIHKPSAEDGFPGLRPELQRLATDVSAVLDPRIPPGLDNVDKRRWVLEAVRQHINHDADQPLQYAEINDTKVAKELNAAQKMPLGVHATAHRFTAEEAHRLIDAMRSFEHSLNVFSKDMSTFFEVAHTDGINAFRTQPALGGEIDRIRRQLLAGGRRDGRQAETVSSVAPLPAGVGSAREDRVIGREPSAETAAELIRFGRRLDPEQRAFSKGWDGSRQISIVEIDQALGRPEPGQPSQGDILPTPPLSPRIGPSLEAGSDIGRGRPPAALDLSGLDPEQRAYSIAWEMSRPPKEARPTVPMIDYALKRIAFVDLSAQDRRAARDLGIQARPLGGLVPSAPLTPSSVRSRDGTPLLTGNEGRVDAGINVGAAPVPGDASSERSGANERRRSAENVDQERSTKRPRFDDRWRDQARERSPTAGLD